MGTELRKTSPFTDFLQAEHRFWATDVCSSQKNYADYWCSRKKIKWVPFTNCSKQNQLLQSEPGTSPACSTGNRIWHHCPDPDHLSHQIRVYQKAEAEGSLLLGQERCLHSPPGYLEGWQLFCLPTVAGVAQTNSRLKQRKELACFWKSCTAWSQAQDLHSDTTDNSDFLH